jgi:hypothetical protein
MSGSSRRLAQLAAARRNIRPKLVHPEAIVAPRSPIPAPPEPGPLPPVIPPAPPGAATDADAESDADDDAIPQSPSSPVATLRSNAIAPIRNQYKCEEQQEHKEAFGFFDADGSGAISAAEVLCVFDNVQCRFCWGL